MDQDQIFRWSQGKLYSYLMYAFISGEHFLKCVCVFFHHNFSFQTLQIHEKLAPGIILAKFKKNMNKFEFQNSFEICFKDNNLWKN